MTEARRDATGEPAISSRTALFVCLILLVLTGLSIGLAHLPIGPWTTVVVLLIAAAQAGLIAMFFMRMRHTGGMPRLVALAALFWLAILMVGTLDDVLTRGWLPVPGK
jgi:cytochrome c oxidase subunit 4